MGQVILFLSVGLASLGQAAPQRVEFPSDLKKWLAIELNDEQELIGNTDFDHEWNVAPGGDTPRVELIPRLKPADQVPTPLPFDLKPGKNKYEFDGWRLFTKVDDGWIVSVNKGEFGGAIWWFSPDGRDRYTLSDANISGFISTNSGLLALDGVNHGFGEKGRIRRLIRDKAGRWTSETFVELEHPPSVAVKQADGSLVVATSEELIKVDPSTKKKEVLVDHLPWGMLYPNSMVIAPSGTIYVGMRHGVARIEKLGASYKHSLLLPNRAFVDQEFVPGFR